MSRFIVASHWAAVFFAAVLLVAQCPAPLRAQSSLLLFKASNGADVSHWLPRLRKIGPHERDPVGAATRRAGISRARLQQLAEVEQLLARARAQAAELAEDEALASLSQAATLADQLGDVPGAAAWQAEVHVRLGVTAAQAGRPELAEFAFERVATLDPNRRLQLAEAPPSVVARFERAARLRALAPAGQFEVRVSVAGASVHLDDLPQGIAPVRVRAAIGRHVLRVEAPGYRTYGASIDVFEGERPAIDVQLAPEPELDAARALLRGVENGDYRTVQRALRAHEQAGAGNTVAWVVETSADASRALLLRCSADGCNDPLRLAATRAPSEAALSAARAPLDSAHLRAARSWLDGPADRAPSFWQRWYVWGGAALLTAVAISAVALSSAPEPQRQLKVVVEPPR